VAGFELYLNIYSKSATFMAPPPSPPAWKNPIIIRSTNDPNISYIVGIQISLWMHS